jgi:plasmid stabilization system protein ParE
LGRVVPEFEQQGYRELIVAPYRIVYEVRQRRVIVLRVWHGRRELRAESVPEEDTSS